VKSLQFITDTCFVIVEVIVQFNVLVNFVTLLCNASTV